MMTAKIPTIESVADAPDVIDARAKLATAMTEYRAADAEMKRIAALISRQSDQLETWEARAALPSAQHRFAIATANKDRAERAMEAARATAKQALDAARREARKPYVREVIKLLEPVLNAVESLNHYDLETEMRGGGRLSPPFPSLLGDLAGGVQWQIDQAKQHLL